MVVFSQEVFSEKRKSSVIVLGWDPGPGSLTIVETGRKAEFIAVYFHKSGFRTPCSLTTSNSCFLEFLAQSRSERSFCRLGAFLDSASPKVAEPFVAGWDGCLAERTGCASRSSSDFVAGMCTCFLNPQLAFLPQKRTCSLGRTGQN